MELSKKSYGGEIQTQKLTYKHVLTFITCALAITGPAAITYSCAGMNYQGVANYLQVPVSSVAFYMTLVYLSIAIFAAPLGNIMEKYNQRVVVTVCALMVGGAELAMSQFTALWMWYIAGVIQGIGITCVQWLLVTGCINKWFKKGAGLALGLCMAGTGLGGVIFNLVGQTVLAGDVSHWRECYVVYGVCILVLSVPFTSLCFRRSPQEWGVLPYGEAINEHDRTQEYNGAKLPGMDYKAALRKPYFWMLMVAGGLMNCMGIMPQLFTTYTQWLAYVGFAGPIVALLALFGTLEAFTQGGQAAGKVIIGAVESRSIPAAIILAGIGGISGLCLIWFGGMSGVLNCMWAGGIAYGLVYGLVPTLHPYLIRVLFGQKDYEKIFSRQLIVTQLIGAFAASGWALVYETFTWNGYFMLGIIIIVVELVIAWFAAKIGFKDTNHAYDPQRKEPVVDTDTEKAAA